MMGKLPIPEQEQSIIHSQDVSNKVLRAEMLGESAIAQLVQSPAQTLCIG